MMEQTKEELEVKKSKKISTKSKAKTTTTKKASATAVKKVTKKNNSVSNVKNKKLNKIMDLNEISMPAEFYDLPYRYNKTIIKILAQTPHSIFLYWDVSDEDRNNFINNYGENFFNETKPILIVHNKTQNYSFEIEVDDFTNSWYLRTPTSNCVFDVELARKKIVPSNDINSNVTVHIALSNEIESPNDHILKKSLNSPILFKNIKTNEYEKKYIDKCDKLYDKCNKLYNLYPNLKLENEFIHNPSSNFKI